MPNKASFPIHDPLLSLSELSVVWEQLLISTRSGNSGHGWEDLNVRQNEEKSVKNYSHFSGLPYDLRCL